MAGGGFRFLLQPASRISGSSQILSVKGLGIDEVGILQIWIFQIDQPACRPVLHPGDHVCDQLPELPPGQRLCRDRRCDQMIDVRQCGVLQGVGMGLPKTDKFLRDLGRTSFDVLLHFCSF